LYGGNPPELGRYPITQNYTEDGQFTATTVMYKVEGYNADDRPRRSLNYRAKGLIFYHPVISGHFLPYTRFLYVRSHPKAFNPSHPA